MKHISPYRNRKHYWENKTRMSFARFCKHSSIGLALVMVVAFIVFLASTGLGHEPVANVAAYVMFISMAISLLTFMLQVLLDPEHRA